MKLYKNKWIKLFTVGVFASISAMTFAEDLGEAATNPLGNLMSFRLQAQVQSFNNADGEGVSGVFQTVLPFQTGWDSIPLFINRTTVAYTSTPELGPEGHVQGLGDTATLNFFIPKEKFLGGTVAFGPAITIPTAGDNEFTGSGQWQLGPNLVYMNSNTPKLQWGALVFGQFSVANTRSDAGNVNVVNIQPIFTKHLDDGWYVAAPDLPQTYNFDTNHWNLNIGPVVGRITKWGNQPIQLFGGVYYNTQDNGDVAPEWTYRFNISFLIPKS